MSLQEGKVKRVVYLNEKMNNDLEIIADEMALSIPDFIRISIAEKIRAYKVSVDAIDTLVQQAMQVVKDNQK